MSDEVVTAVDSGPSNDDVIDLLEVVVETCYNVGGWGAVDIGAEQNKAERTVTVTITYGVSQA